MKMLDEPKDNFESVDRQGIDKSKQTRFLFSPVYPFPAYSQKLENILTINISPFTIIQRLPMDKQRVINEFVPKGSIQKPGGLLRIFFRIPLLCFRIGLGSLFPMQMQITTKGRRTGLQHKVVVDILERDEMDETSYVSSAYGHESDWYKNLIRNSVIGVQVGSRTYIANATPLSIPERERILGRYVSRHPRLARILMRLVGMGSAELANMRYLARITPVVAIRSIGSHHLTLLKKNKALYDPFHTTKGETSSLSSLQ